MEKPRSGVLQYWQSRIYCSTWTRHHVVSFSPYQNIHGGVNGLFGGVRNNEYISWVWAEHDTINALYWKRQYIDHLQNHVKCHIFCIMMVNEKPSYDLFPNHNSNPKLSLALKFDRKRFERTLTYCCIEEIHNFVSVLLFWDSGRINRAIIYISHLCLWILLA